MADDLREAKLRADRLEAKVAAIRGEDPAWAPGDGGAFAAARLEPDPVIFRRRGGRLEIETRGPPHVFIPRLFALARDESDPDLSSLALSSLEGILGDPDRAAESGGEEEALDPGVGPAKWLRRGVAVFTSAAGAGDAGAESMSRSETPRERRLRALEGAWRRAAGEEGSNRSGTYGGRY
jgi:hypothetical protein